MGALFIGIVTAGVSIGYVYMSEIQNTYPNAPIISGIIGFLIGYFEFSIIASVINSGVATTFVCLAEDPAALARTKPELYQKIQQVYPEIMLGF
jgi:xanthosine utilization system XapX-like protein